MKMKYGMGLALLLVLSQTHVVNAQAAGCSLTLEGVGGVIDLSGVYLPAAASGASASTVTSTAVPVALKVKNTGTASCPFVLAIQSPAASATRYVSAPSVVGLNPAPDATRIPYAVQNGANEVKGDVGSAAVGTPASDASQVVQGKVSPGSEFPIALNVSLQSLALVAFDNAPYQDTLTFSLYNGTYAALGTKVSDNTMTVQVAVKPQMRMAFTPVGAVALYKDNPDDYTLNFGELKKGQEQTLQIALETNDGYELTFVSDHASKMVCAAHATASDEQKSVAYEMYVGPANTPYDLANTSASPFRSNILTVDSGTLIQASDVRSSLPIKFVVTGDPEKALAGQYEDVITVTYKNPT